ncbi:hypothetical protein [Sinanaerobacter chloroacetimidivorans]|uniref:Uncharacterized protein n=1 Tax=Sinanaerobacter chloroacetimidivorans TaxID=2818044 RepID=A0A8J7VYD5_9FIRM|nr:hypothetical protein [Sinanaerobacter chloroacetimidivorans]MBR0596293.1 hypothetical protein [Sinanaerobacter chloroacetimidivorans]
MEDKERLMKLIDRQKEHISKIETELGGLPENLLNNQMVALQHVKTEFEKLEKALSKL